MSSLARQPDRTAEACPTCGIRLVVRRSRVICPACHDAAADRVHVIDGALVSAAGPLALGLELSTIILGLLFVFDLLSVVTAIVSLMPGIISVINWRANIFRIRKPAQLVCGVDGAAVIRRGKVRRFTPWRFFDEVRIRAARRWRQHAPDEQREYELVLVNTYKPTISAYLSTRGTNDPAHAFPVELLFEATPSRVEDLRTQLQARINAARAQVETSQAGRHSAVDASAEGLLNLTHCPSCSAELQMHRGQKHCSLCANRFPADTFILPGRSIDRHWPRGLVIVALLTMALLSLLATNPVAALLFGSTAAALIVIFYWPMLLGQQKCELLLAGEHGLEQWLDGTLAQRWPWSQLPTFRALVLNGGQWRLAFWTRSKSVTRFNHMLFSWLTNPPGGPEIDLVLDENERTGWRICHEIELCRRRAGVAPE